MTSHQPPDGERRSRIGCGLYEGCQIGDLLHDPRCPASGQTTPASAEPTEVDAMRAWIADHAPVWVEQVGEQPEAAVVSLSDAAFVAAQFTAITLASQRAEIVARYDQKWAAAVCEAYIVGNGNGSNGLYDPDQVKPIIARIREAAPK